MSVDERDEPRESQAAAEGSRFGPVLALWMAACVALNGVLWAGGFRSVALSDAVERGAARVESRGIGEVSDDLIRKAIRTQHDTLPFWTTLTLLGDFLAEPLALAGRALATATVFAALAALVGRPVRYDLALAECSKVQGVWVLGLAIRVGLMAALRRGDAETSLALFLPAGSYPAAAWLALRQLDAFAVLGWGLLARGAWRRGQVNLATAVAVCVVLGIGEAVVRVVVSLMFGAAMRLDLVPA